MWYLIILSVVINRNLMAASVIESENNNDPLQPQDDDPVYDSNMYLYMDQQMLKSRKSAENDDIEARRRSALDKNFMRFGRGGEVPSFHDELDNDYSEEYVRPERTLHRSDNFLRFGRGKSSDFIRFGRDFNKAPRGKDKNIIRFGRAEPERNRRDADEPEEVKKHDKNMFRFGRNKNFLRFGRTSHGTNLQMHPVNYTLAYKFLVHPHSFNILPLFQKLTSQIQHENKCEDCSRFDD